MDLSLSVSADARRAERIVERVFRDYPGGMAVRLWDGRTLTVGSRTPECTLLFREPRAFRRLILFRDPLRLAEAYCLGKVDVEGDFYAALHLKDHLQSLRLSTAEKATLLARAVLLEDSAEYDAGDDAGDDARSAVPAWHASLLNRLTGTHSKVRDRQAIAFHYDVSNDFYALWLDEQRIYSCAYYEDAGQSLEQAQCNKLEHICRKLRLELGERLLDIGCGWGALVCWAAEHYGVNAHGITLSQNQYDYAQGIIKQRGLEQKVSVALLDYRDLQGDACYDKIASVGMFEHVGLKNLPVYFDCVHRMLKPGGLFLNHGITSDKDGWKRSAATEFINRYVFPDGQLETLSTVQQIMEAADFEIHDVEGLRRHYALTLREWVRRLELRREEALHHVSESVYRIWRLYMAACALQFEEGNTGIYQILASRREPFASPVPLTRRDLYRQPC